MADGHGGYRRPAHPAAVSGEGKLARRTDGRPSDNPKQAKLYLQGDGSYGDSKDLNEVAAGAPLSAAGVSVPAVVPFDAPTERPDEPVTAGADFGLGGGTELWRAPVSEDEAKYLAKMNYLMDPSFENRRLFNMLHGGE